MIHALEQMISYFAVLQLRQTKIKLMSVIDKKAQIITIITTKQTFYPS